MTLTDITTLSGLAGLIASVALLAWQMRAVAQQTKISNSIAGASVLETSTSDLREILLLFVAHPGLRAYFYESKRPPRNGRQRVRVVSIAEIIGDCLETGLVANRLIPATESLEDWSSYCSEMLATSQILRELTIQHPQWWPQLALLQGIHHTLEGL